jgi:FkbM family methyltransferase
VLAGAAGEEKLMKQPKRVRELLRKAGLDVARWPRRPDDTVMDWSLTQVLRALDINCVIDVGGNAGGFGGHLRELGYAGRIVSFEPSPSSLPALTKLAARDGNWRVRPVGLSSEPGSAELNLYQWSVLDSLHAKRPDLGDRQPHLVAGFGQTGTATVTLSTLADEYHGIIADLEEPRVLLKSDTQGHDLEVLAGAKGLAPEIAAVFVELSAQALYDGQPSMTRVIDALLAEGFSPVAFQPVGRSADELRVIEFDGLFMRQPRDGTGFAVGQRVKAALGVLR